ncbi:MAG: PadR family transcriptional regulator [Gemmatimonadales bacterium]
MSDPGKPVPLRPVVFEILLILNQGERHGYGLMKELRERPGGRWVLGPGTLYRTLREMLEQGLIEPGGSPSDARGKRDYRLTPLGRRVAAAEARRMARLVGIAVEGGLLSRS